MYLWEKLDWPTFTWDEQGLARLLGKVARGQGRLFEKVESLGFGLCSEAHLCTLIEDVVKLSEIEDEKLERNQVRSSLARRLRMDVVELVPTEGSVEGVVPVTH